MQTINKRIIWCFEGEKIFCLPNERYTEARPDIPRKEKLIKYEITVKRITSLKTIRKMYQKQ